MKTFFYALENGDNDLSKVKNTATSELIDDPNSLFAVRLSRYYKINYTPSTSIQSLIPIFDRDLFDHIQNNEMYEKDSENEFYNLWIAYMNGNYTYINEDYIKVLKNTDWCNGKDCFYAIAITIFIIERCMKSMMS